MDTKDAVFEAGRMQGRMEVLSELVAAVADITTTDANRARYLTCARLGESMKAKGAELMRVPSC